MTTAREKARVTRLRRRLREQAEAVLRKMPPTVPTPPTDEVKNIVHELRVHQAELEMQNEELRCAQLDLENSRDRFARLYDFAPVGYLTLDAGSVIHEANLTAARLLGLDRRALVRKKFSSLVAGKSQDDFYRHFQQVFAHADRQHCELQLRLADGTTFSARLESVVEPAVSGQPARCLTTLTDVTAQRRAESALRESQAQLTGIIRSARDAIVTVDSQQRIVLCNEAAERMFGHPPGGLLDQPLDWLIPENLREEYARHLREFGSPGPRNRQTATLGNVFGRRSDGTTFPVEASISQIEVNGRKFFTVILRDITERVRADEALRIEKEFSENLVATAPVIVLVQDPAGRIVRFNRYLEELSGHRLEDVQGRDWFATFLAPGDRRRIRRVFANTLQSRAPVRRSISPILTKDGRLREIEWFNATLKAAAGTTGGVLAIGLDVTEQLKAEATLHRNEAELNDFFHESPLGLLWVGPDGRILRANRAFAELVEGADKEIGGRLVGEFYVDPAEAAATLELLASRKTLRNHRARLRHADGILRHVLIDANALWEKRKMRHSRWFVRDITARVALEGELVQISEFEQQRIGRELHDSLGQHLHALYFLAMLMAKDLAAESSSHAAEAARLSQLLEESLQMTRSLSHGLQPVTPVPEGLMAALREFAARIRGTYRIDCRFQCRNPVLVENTLAANHLFRIAQEAVNNALKHARPTRIRVVLAAANGKIVLGIRDNGTGIRLPTGHATGAGLRIMQHRADSIDSSLVVQKRPGCGTEVVCTVPATVLQRSNFAK